mgnify:CR=1 FL=1
MNETLTLDEEKTLLGCLLMGGVGSGEVFTLVEAKDFQHWAHQAVFAVMQDLFMAGVDIDAISVLGGLEKRGELGRIDGAMVHDLMSKATTKSDIPFLAGNVKERSRKRQLWSLAAHMETLCQEPSVTSTDVLGRVRDGLDSIMLSSSAGGAKHIESLDWLADAMAGTLPQGVMTGFRGLDAMLQGLQGGQLVVVAARPGCGKSTLAVDFMREISIRNGAATLMFSLEMSSREIQQRILAAETCTNISAIRGGHVSVDQFEVLKRAAGEISSAPIYISDDASQTIMDIVSRAKIEVRKNDVRLIVVDYLQLITPANVNVPRQEQVAQMTRQLKILAKDLNVPIVLVAQLNRNSENRDGGTPRASDLRESGAIEQDADIILLIDRPDAKDPDHQRAGEADIIVAKNRGGATGVHTIAHQLHYSRFKEFPRGM